VLQGPGFAHQHDRNAVAHRIGKPRLAADQLACDRIIFKRSVRGGAHQDLQQLGIDARAPGRCAGGIVRWGAHRWQPDLFERGIARLQLARLGGVPSAEPKVLSGEPKAFISRRATRSLARAVESLASKSACFSAGPKGSTIDNDVTRLASAACFTASQSVERLRPRKNAARPAIRRSRSSSINSLSCSRSLRKAENTDDTRR